MPGDLRRVRPDEWEALRDIRLRALRDSPDAFGATYAASSARPAEWWREWARSSAELDTQAIFVAVADGDLVGLAGAFEADGKWTIYTMWVEPAHRGGGIGRALLDAVVAFARQHGAQDVHLDATDGNHAARALYERYGFVDTGASESLASNPSLTTRALRLRL